MFGWGSGLALPPISSDPDKERKPPSSPTPLDFPVYNLPDVAANGSDSTIRGMHGLLAAIKRPEDISIARFRPLNVKMDSDVDVQDMFPKDQTQSLPPVPWEEAEDPAEPPLLDNGVRYPPKDRFEILNTELSLDNDDAFREVTRLPLREGRSRVRVSQSRKFWVGLERLSQYWDTSLDHYFERPATPEPTPSADGEQADEDRMQVDQDKPQIPMDVDEPQAPDVASRPSVAMYTGRRMGCGPEMPDEVRDEVVRAFMELAAWPFGCQVTVPPLPPRLMVRSLLFPVRQSFQACRSPRDRQVARSGTLEGPVLIAQCRPETSFRTPDETPGSGVGEVCDIFREVGGMLLAAQERSRYSGIELRPGEGKWWTTTPRFGGAPNDGVLEDLINNSHGMSLPDSMMEEGKPASPAPEPESARKRHKFEHYASGLSRRPSAMRKLSNSEKWKILQPGTSLWDKRMKYMQIGKVPESPFDDIYMVSSINHHISILHLRVHRRYLEILGNGDSSFPPDTDSSEQPWHVLKLQRTRWFDLLDGNDRVEGLKAVWRLFHYQLRKV
ncbi:uncharacterized protein PFLUO_LOCUS9140 [Penicillium psychrofluorescens]|uniref:uncharacterized protein n=1 Tax=Penicillium psychrofluorescens TaxID=3158075 RepID=UPI003CCDE14C